MVTGYGSPGKLTLNSCEELLQGLPPVQRATLTEVARCLGQPRIWGLCECGNKDLPPQPVTKTTLMGAIHFRAMSGLAKALPISSLSTLAFPFLL